MAIESVSFSGKYSKTPNGSYYKKKNTGKKIGTMVGIATGVGLSALPQSQIMAMGLAAKMFPKNPMKMFGATYGILIAGITAISLAFRGLGAIPDSAVNKRRIARADHIA